MLAMGREEFDSFFASEAVEEMNAICDTSLRFDLDAKCSQEAYAAAIQTTNPEILTTAWDSPKLTGEMTRGVSSLRYLCHVCGSVRAYVEESLIEEGLLVTNWGEVGAEDVAEHALAFILASLRRIVPYQFEMHDNNRWPSEIVPSRLRGKSVGLYGLGNTAKALAKLLRALDCSVLAYDPYRSDSAFEEHGVMRAPTLMELFRGSDIVSIHCGLTEETIHSVSFPELRALRDGGLLVNCARGAVVDDSALVEEVSKGRIWAAIDVYEEEPLPESSPLRGLPQLIMTPHVGGPTPESKKEIGNRAVENIRRYVEGRGLISLIDTKRLRWMT